MEQIRTSDCDGVRTIVFTNPPRGYLNAATSSELCDALSAAVADPEVHVLVFTGGLPGVFIRHYDVAEIVAVGEAVLDGRINGPGPRETSPVYRLFDALLACPKPTVAAINGTCMGGGFEFALACDLRVAEAGSYTIGLPETRLGIIPGVGGLQLLARVVGLSRATEMVMRGRVVGPAEALSLGLVHELSDGPVLPAVQSLAADLAARPSHAVASVKAMAATIAAGEPLAGGLDTAARQFMDTLRNPAAMLAMRRFLSNGEDILR